MTAKTPLFLVLAIFFGAVLGGAVSYFVMSSTSNDAGMSAAPLYWVSPMDPTYRRDSPGTSPMGMELVPVYSEGSASTDMPGMVSISAQVENNLGVRTELVKIQPFVSTI